MEKQKGKKVTSSVRVGAEIKKGHTLVEKVSVASRTSPVFRYRQPENKVGDRRRAPGSVFIRSIWRRRSLCGAASVKR